MASWVATIGGILSGYHRWHPEWALISLYRPGSDHEWYMVVLCNLFLRSNIISPVPLLSLCISEMRYLRVGLQPFQASKSLQASTPLPHTCKAHSGLSGASTVELQAHCYSSNSYPIESFQWHTLLSFFTTDNYLLSTVNRWFISIYRRWHCDDKGAIEGYERCIIRGYW